jgi:alpha-ribazole phosphatase
LQRCAGLADRLADRLANPPPRFDARLAEIDFGSWEMLNWCDIARSEIDAWAADPIDYHPGGGESVLQVAARVRDFQQDLQRQQFAQAIVLCHAGTVRLLCAMQHGGSLRDCARRAASAPHSIAYGTMLTIEI